jgi:hypothetical protein
LEDEAGDIRSKRAGNVASAQEFAGEVKAN